ncbi:MAG: hypothetical protein AABZ06_14455 [Bdellovibrionota bacterium]
MVPIGKSRNALVLGPLEAGLSIAERLEMIGLSADIQPNCGGYSARSPNGDTGSFSTLKSLLSEFVRSVKHNNHGHAPYLHPGVSHWAERPELVTLGQELGLSVVCPSTRVLSLFGNKLNLLGEAEKRKIPTLTISLDPFSSISELRRFVAKELKKFPFVIRSAHGNGSFGIRTVYDEDDLERFLPLWIEQLRIHDGEVILFAERYLDGARHITVPFIRFMRGDAKIFPTVDSSLQHRHRKLIESCPAQTALIYPVEQKLKDWTIILAEQCRFIGAGAFEFLVDGVNAYLVDGVPRLTTSFVLWEKVAGINAVEWQIAAIEGRPPPSDEHHDLEERKLHGVAARLFTEDAILQVPQPGFVHEVSVPQEQTHDDGAWSKVIVSLKAGTMISPESNGLVGIVYGFASETGRAFSLCEDLIKKIWVSGSLQTNERFLMEILNHPWVRQGFFHYNFIDGEFVPLVYPDTELVSIAVRLCSMAYSYGSLEDPPKCHWIIGGRKLKPTNVEIKWSDGPAEIPGKGIAGVIEKPGGTLRVCAFPLTLSPYSMEWQVRIGVWAMRLKMSAMSSEKSTNKKHRLFIRSLVSGKVHSIFFKENAVVRAHDPLLVVESLGILVPHSSPKDVRVLEWMVRAEDLIDRGKEAVRVEFINNENGDANNVT